MWEVPVSANATSVGLYVHRRSVVACGLDGRTGELFERRSAKRPKKSTEAAELERLRARNAKLEADLTKTRTALDIMRKAHALLEQLSESVDETEPRAPRKRR
jgi:hypothetical protein